MVLLGCAAAQTGQLALTSSEAARIADAKAQSTGHDLHQYDRSPAKYDDVDKSWWINYVRKGEKYAAFNIRVADKTKEAWLVLE